MIYYLYVLLFSNGKRYFGISYQVAKRFEDHLSIARKGEDKRPVYRALRKYAGQVVCQIVCVGLEPYIQALEVKAIAAYRTMDRRYGYNLAPGGDLSPMLNPEVAKKVSVTKKQRYRDDPEFRALIDKQVAFLSSPDIRAKTNAAIRTPEVSAAKSKKLKGRKVSPHALAALIARNSDPIYLAELSRKVTLAWTDPQLLAEQSARFKGRAIPIPQRLQISATLMGHPGWGKGEKRPEISALISSLVWITDDKTSRRVLKGSELPIGWRFGRKGGPIKGPKVKRIGPTERQLASLARASAVRAQMMKDGTYQARPYERTPASREQSRQRALAQGARRRAEKAMRAYGNGEIPSCHPALAFGAGSLAGLV